MSGSAFGPGGGFPADQHRLPEKPSSRGPAKDGSGGGWSSGGMCNKNIDVITYPLRLEPVTPRRRSMRNTRANL